MAKAGMGSQGRGAAGRGAAGRGGNPGARKAGQGMPNKQTRENRVTGGRASSPAGPARAPKTRRPETKTTKPGERQRSGGASADRTRGQVAGQRAGSGATKRPQQKAKPTASPPGVDKTQYTNLLNQFRNQAAQARPPLPPI